LSTFVKGLAWTVALLSGIATIFALFGGQQWLEQQGWTLAPSAAPTTEAVETAESEDTPQEAAATSGTGDTEPEPSDTGTGFSWDGVIAWSERTFDNPLWGIAAIGGSMLLAGIAGALCLHATSPITVLGGILLGLLGLVCAAAVILVGFLLHAADPGYLGWFVILTVFSAPLGYAAPVFSDRY
jgi:hypothetical protein